MATQKSKKGWWMIPFLSLVLIYAAFAFSAQSHDIYNVNIAIKELENKIDQGKTRQQDLIEEMDEISSDASIEKIAREKLGMVRDGERVFVDTNK